MDELANSISKIMNKHGKNYPNIVIGGDYNFPDVDWENWTTTNPRTAATHNKFLNFLLENSLSQLQTKVTRPISNSVLDLVATTCPQLISNVEVVPGISDHDIVLFDINMNPKVQRKPPHKIYNFNRADLDTLKACTEEFCKDFLESNPLNKSVDSNWSSIRDNLQSLMDSHVPSKMKSGKRNLPWITNSIKRQMRKRDRLFRLARKSNTTVSWRYFRQYRNSLTKTIKLAHVNYINNIIGESIVDRPKTFWSYVKLMRTENLGTPVLRTETKLCTTDADKAEALNQHFQSVFTPPSEVPVPDKGSSPFPSVPNLIIHQEGVLKQLNQLNPSKASGPDELPPRLLKTVAEELSPALTVLFQQSIDSGTVPSQWRQAIVTSIYKKKGQNLTLQTTGRSHSLVCAARYLNTSFLVTWLNI